MTRYGMAIDLKGCIACHACSVACKSNNNLPNGIWYNTVVTDGGAYMDTARGTYPNDLHRVYYPTSCMHCVNAACVEACPTGASFKREDGIVSINKDECIGCSACINACPYDVRTLLGEDPGYVVDFPLGDWDAPAHVANTMEKCTFCANRIDRGEVPACMEMCPGHARFWGDLDDPESEVSKFLEGKEWIRLLEDAGTEPNVYYVTSGY